ncbi:MAG: antitoxin [Gemmatimonadetes bacterium]|nr:antitoxin [Gemmatimonadota bacterium]
MMGTRLQVILEDDELAEIRQVAAAQRMTVAEWVRQALRRARATEPRLVAEQKLRVVRESARYGYPSGDIAELLDQTARGRAEADT